MGAHHRRETTGAAMDRPAFDEVAQGYDRRQVDDYLGALWRYASEVTSRAATAEAALRHERDRREAEARLAEGVPAQAGGRIGIMLEIAQREADDIIAAAREIAASALEEAISAAGTNHPIAREAREQAEKLLLDAVEESRRIALTRHEDLEAQIARGTHSLEALRRQQGEIIGAVLRLRRLLGEDEIDRAVTDLVRAGLAPEDLTGAPGGRPAGAGLDGGESVPSGPAASYPQAGRGDGVAPPGPPGSGRGDTTSSAAEPGRPGGQPTGSHPTDAFATGGFATGGFATGGFATGGFTTDGHPADSYVAGGFAAGDLPADDYAAEGFAGRNPPGFAAEGARYATASGHAAGGTGARPGRHRQQRDVAEAEPYPAEPWPAGERAGGFVPNTGQPVREPAAEAAHMPTAGFRPAREDDIIDAEIVEE